MATNNAVNTSFSATPDSGKGALWDTNSNLSANSYLSGWSTTSRVRNGAYALTAASTEKQQYTGSGATDAVLLPLASTMQLGQTFTLYNSAGQTLPVYDSTHTNQITSIPAESGIEVTCILTSGATAASWFIGALVAPFSNMISTPTFTFNSAGDLSVSYTTQVSNLITIPCSGENSGGNLVVFSGQLVFTPTFTTSTGVAEILIPSLDGTISIQIINLAILSGVTYPVGATTLAGSLGSGNGLRILATGSAISGSSLQATNFTSGTAVEIQWSGTIIGT